MKPIHFDTPSSRAPQRSFRQRACLLLSLSALALGLLACANPAFKEAETLTQLGQHEAALARLQQASDQTPEDAALLQATVRPPWLTFCIRPTRPE